MADLALAHHGSLEPSVPARPLTAQSAGRATKRGKPDLAVLQKRLEYTFKDQELLARALTHVSAPVTTSEGRIHTYQRLEFLGDRVLGVVVAEMLYRAYPMATEGELSMRLAKLVRRETCAAVAAEWDVGPHVVMGLGESRGGGRKKAAILSDICESLIGAVFLDSGFDEARALVERGWGLRMSSEISAERDAKTAAQEWAQGRALGAPRYVEVSRSGPAHNPVFVIQIELEGFDPERGEATSKRAAEQAAAQAFLNRWAAT